MGKCKCTFNSFILPPIPTLQFRKTTVVLLFYISTVYYIKRSGEGSIYQLPLLGYMTQNTKQVSLKMGKFKYYLSGEDNVQGTCMPSGLPSIFKLFSY